MDVVSTEWKHKICRSSKDGYAVFDGRGWRCSRCGGGYLVNTEGCSQEEANEMFWKLLADVCFTRFRAVKDVQENDELSPLLGDFSSEGLVV